MNPIHRSGGEGTGARVPWLHCLLLLWFGSFTVPHAAAQGLFPDIAVEQVPGSAITDQGSLIFGVVDVGTPVTKTLRVRNTGSLPLLDIQITSTGPADFTFSSLPGTLAGGTTVDFTVTFNPSSAGSRTGRLAIASNDPDEDPFDINLSGTGSQPELSVRQGGVNLISDVSVVGFGNVKTGATISRTFSIRNDGTGTLQATISVSGAAFHLLPVNPIALTGGASRSFTVNFEPASAASFNGNLSITSNDPDEQSFRVRLEGTGIIPLLEVEDSGGNVLSDGADEVAFGTSDPGVPVAMPLTLRNVSTAPLTGLALSIDGTHASDFTFDALPATTLQPGASMNFTVRFQPSASGDRTAALHLVSDQTAANPHDLGLTGTGNTVELADLEDNDHDGILNLMELATGTDPLVPGAAPGSLVKNGDTLEFTFPRRSDWFEAVNFTVEWSDDLAVWEPVSHLNITRTGGDDINQIMRAAISAGPHGRRSVRFRVTRK